MPHPANVHPARLISLSAVTRVAIAASLVAGLLDLGPVSAKEFDPRVITFGDTREQIKSTPVTARPNRPLHVYGNTVRRRADRAARPTATQTR
jgi:hypothetical protein